MEKVYTHGIDVSLNLFMLNFLKKKEPKEVILEEKNQSAFDMSALLIRHLLGSVDFSDINRDEKTESDKKHFNQSVAAFYPHVIKPTIEKLVIAQQELMSRGSEDISKMYARPDEQVIFGRGTINGLFLVLEEFQEAFNEYTARVSEGKEDFDKHKLFPEIFPKESGES